MAIWPRGAVSQEEKKLCVADIRGSVNRYIIYLKFMPSIERKNINGRPFLYISEQVRTRKGYKKIQVYLGKSIPKKLKPFYVRLKNKEIELTSKENDYFFSKEKLLDMAEITKIERLRIGWKYKDLVMTKAQRERFWRRFAIQFIFESNAIEGSRLSESEVSSIVRKRSIKKTIEKKEILEVINSIEAFEYLKNDNFKLNQRTIIMLHSIIMRNLDVRRGYKQSAIVVNNKNTTAPGKVRSDMARLIVWLNAEKKKKRHPLLIFADFHQRFEKIHPFEDGNGRCGRLLFNWMLFKASYPPILFRKKNRDAYFNALNKADDGRCLKWHWHVANVYKKSIKEYLKWSGV